MTQDRTISDKESWLIKHGSLKTEPTAGMSYDVWWVCKSGGPISSGRASTYFGAINMVYDQVKERLWNHIEFFLDKNS